MIKWLICFLWGHDLDKDINNYAQTITTKLDTGEESVTKIAARCKRCLKYKVLYRI